MDVGELWVTRQTNRGRDEVRIDRADPRIEIADELMHDIKRNGPHARYDPHHETVTIIGSNRTVIYRILDYDRQQNTWLMEWPD